MNLLNNLFIKQHSDDIPSHFKKNLIQRLIQFSLFLLLTPAAVLPVMATDIEAANTNTLVNTAKNGVPVIDIASPNDAGVSYNRYQNFNVSEQGAVLNNSIAFQTETTLAGEIAANPHLQGKAAYLIINEVVSANPSVLNGALEVAGQAAQVIAANPYGITCDGCGFINTPDVRLVAGSVQFGNAGQFKGFDVMSPHEARAKYDATIIATDRFFQNESGKTESGGSLHIHDIPGNYHPIKSNFDTAGLLSSQRFKLEGDNWHNQGQVQIVENNVSLNVRQMLNEGSISAGNKTLVQREWLSWSPWAPFSSGQPTLRWE